MSPSSRDKSRRRVRGPDRQSRAQRALHVLLGPHALFTGVLVVLFFGIGLAGLMQHEMWRDEFESWLIARDSPSLPDVFRTMRYAGHPALWHTLLYFICRVTRDPFAMQLFHLLIATGTVYVLLRFSPFSRLQKALFMFGYFPLFEYCLISRNYGMGVLFLFCVCALFPVRRRRYLGLACVLFLLAQVTVHSLIIGLALAAVLVAEAAFRKDVRATLRARRGDIIVSAVIVLAGVSVSIVQLWPPPDSGFAVSWQTAFDAGGVRDTLTAVWRSYVPFPAIEHQFWNSNIVAGPSWQALFSVVLLVLAALCFSRRPLALFLYVLGTVGLLAFSYVKYSGFLRHHGHLYVLFVACLWLAPHFPARASKAGLLGKLPDAVGRYRNAFFVSLLGVQAIAGVVAVGYDWRHPFSAGKQVAAFIKEQGLDGTLIVADSDYAAQAVVGYLDQQVYYPRSGRFGTFVVWNASRRGLHHWQVVEKAQQLSAERGEPVLLVLNYGMTRPPEGIVELGRFGDTIVANERYWLFLVRPDRARSSPPAVDE